MIYDVIKYGVWNISDFYFPAELIIAELLFMFVFARRKNFILRFVASFVILVSFVFFVPPYYGKSTGFGSEADIFGQLYSIAYSLLIFFVTILLSIFLFNTEKRNVLFCCAAGFSVQHITFRVLEIFYLFISEELVWLRLVVRVVLDGGLYFLFWYWLARRLRIDDSLDIGNKNVIILSLAAIFINVVLCSFCRMEKVGIITQIAESAYSAGCCVLILCLQFNLFQKKELEKKTDMIEHMWEEDRKHYQINKAYIEEINLKAHDLKHAIGALRHNGAEEFAAEAERSLEKYSTIYHTGNEALDVVLTEKSMLCSAMNIKLTCLADGKKLMFIRDVDLYSCIGNALDNAITAADKVQDGEKRIISLTLSRNGGMLCLHVENYFVGELSVCGGVLKTTKEDKKSHGFGIRSIEMIAKKYNGFVAFTADDGIFNLNIFFAAKD